VSRWQAGCGQKDAWEQQQEDIQTGVSCAAAQAAKNDLLNQNSSSCYKTTLDETSVMEALCGFFFDGIFQSFVILHQNAEHGGGKEGTRRARLVVGGGKVRPSLC